MQQLRLQRATAWLVSALLFLLLAPLGAETDIVYFSAQPPDEPGHFDAPEETFHCDESYTPLEVHVVLPDAGIGANTGLLVNLPGISVQADCSPQPLYLSDWHNSKDLAVATVYYRNLSYWPPTDFGKLAIGDVLRGTAAVLEAFPINRRRIYLYGGSGGGHLALQVYQAAPHLWNEVHVHASITKITTAADLDDGYLTRWNGNLQFPEEQGALSEFLWRRYQAERDLRSPQYHVRRDPRTGGPPVWMFHGTADPLVSIQHMYDYVLGLAAALGQEPVAATPVISLIENYFFVEILGGNHAYAGAAPDEDSRVRASEKYVPECFTSIRSTSPELSVDYTTPLSFGYALQIRGALEDAEVHVAQMLSAGADWDAYE